MGLILTAILLLAAYTALEITNMAQNMDKMREEIAQAKTVMESAGILIAGLADEIRANMGNDEAMGQLADDLDSQSTALERAITENTQEA